jgi:hypothetical protein
MSETVSAQLAAVAAGANSYEYTVTLDDTGPTPIGTFWFAWDDFPDQNFLPVAPTAVQAPPGWSAIVTHDGGTDGYGIQWVASSAAYAITPGNTLTGFTFSTTADPFALLSPSTVDASFMTTSSFVYAGGPESDAGYNFVVPGTSSPGTVASAYAAIERTQPSTAVLGPAFDQVATGQQTLAQYESGLIASEPTLYTALPALVTIDAFYNATPSASTLNAVAASTGSPSQTGGFYAARYLHNLGYSDPNVWTILASQWGADQTSSFYQQYNNFGTNYSGFISAAYTQEFGAAPSAANLQNLLNDVPGVQALLAGGGGAATPIQVESGVYGYLLYIGQTTPSLTTPYATAADDFLRAAANGTVNYGEELTKQFPTDPPGALPGYAMGDAMADPNVITVTGSDQLIDPGTGNFSIQFQPGAVGDTLVVHGGGVDQVSGFDPGTDMLDVGSLLAGSGLALTGDIASLSGYLTVADQAGDALVRFDPAGQGKGGTVAVLRGLGSSVTGLDSLIEHGAVRMS